MCLLSALCVWTGWGRMHTAEFQWCLLALMECFNSAWLFGTVLVLSGTLSACSRRACEREQCKAGSTVDLACQTYWRSELGEHGEKNIFTKSYRVWALISCDWILLPCPFRVLHGLAGRGVQYYQYFPENTVDSKYVTWYSLYLCPFGPICLFSTAFREWILKSSLSSPKATDSDISCVQNVPSPCKSVILAMNF